MHVAVGPPVRAFVPDASHSEGLMTPQLVDERAKMPCVRSHVSPTMSAASDPKTYIRTYIRDTFGYIRIHSGKFRYIRTEADHIPTQKTCIFTRFDKLAGYIRRTNPSFL